MLTPRERQFLKMLLRKYQKDDSRILLRSLVVITGLVTAAHLLERTSLPSWLVFVLIYIPTVFMFTRYRKFEVFKMRILVNLAKEAGIDQDAPSTGHPGGPGAPASPTDIPTLAAHPGS